MSRISESIERRQLRGDLSSLSPVRVHPQVIAITRRGNGAREILTVRKRSFPAGGEPTFALHSRKERSKAAASNDGGRVRLYHLRARVAEWRWGIDEDLGVAKPQATEPVDAGGVGQEEAEVELVEAPKGEEEVPESAEQPETEAGGDEETQGQSGKDPD
jgi:hypothetical protein